MMIKRGQLIWVDFGERRGSCQGGRRPAVVVQNNTGNKFSTTLTVIPITSRDKNKMPVHTKLTKDYEFVASGSVIMGEQLTVIDKQQVMSAGDMLTIEDMKSVNRVISIQLSLSLAA